MKSGSHGIPALQWGWNNQIRPEAGPQTHRNAKTQAPGGAVVSINPDDLCFDGQALIGKEGQQDLLSYSQEPQ